MSNTTELMTYQVSCLEEPNPTPNLILNSKFAVEQEARLFYSRLQFKFQIEDIPLIVLLNGKIARYTIEKSIIIDPAMSAINNNRVQVGYKWLLLHEVCHAIQEKNKRLDFINFPKFIIFNKKQYTKFRISDFNSLDEYDNLPWEKEANRFADEWEKKCNFI